MEKTVRAKALTTGQVKGLAIELQRQLLDAWEVYKKGVKLSIPSRKIYDNICTAAEKAAVFINSTEGIDSVNIDIQSFKPTGYGIYSNTVTRSNLQDWQQKLHNTLLEQEIQENPFKVNRWDNSLEKDLIDRINFYSISISDKEELSNTVLNEFLAKIK